MLDFYLNLGFESSYELWHEAMPLVDDFILVLNSMSVVNELFPDVILEKFSNDLKEVSFVPSISFSVYYQVFQEGDRIFPNLA